MDESEPGIINSLKVVKTLIQEERAVLIQCPFLRLPEYVDLFNDVSSRSLEVIGQGRNITQLIQNGSADIKKEMDQYKDELEKRIKKEEKNYPIAKRPGK